MKIYLPRQQSADDYSSIKRNGMWYVHWQSGYLDILKKGYPKPKNDETILAELHSPNVDDFLHGSTSQVPFIITDNARKVLEHNNISGIRFAEVEIVKIATKGKKRTKSKSGEPEDTIVKSKNKLSEVTTPKLHAVYISGRVNVVLDYPSGRSPVKWVSPFEFDFSGKNIPDLFRPFHDGMPFSAWAFCSERFANSVLAAELTNIKFETFDVFMKEFRDKTKREIDKRKT
jgi:hypothetical protein